MRANKMGYTHASLFSGIGGFDLAADISGYSNIFNCDNNPFCKRILNYYWPNTKHYEDISTTDFTIYRNKIFLLSGGFPCQPFSVAGKRKGTSDNRYLWPEMLRAIHEIQPTWVIAENVGGFISMQNGLVFNKVLSSMEVEGYEVQPFIIPACAIDAPHRRDRVWIIAYRSGIGFEQGRSNRFGKEKNTQERADIFFKSCGSKCEPVTSHTDSQRLQKCNASTITEKSTFRDYFRNFKAGSCFSRFPTQSPVYSGNDGIPPGLSGITFPKWRSESIKAYGNAIVPQVAYQIFKSIKLITKE